MLYPRGRSGFCLCQRKLRTWTIWLSFLSAGLVLCTDFPNKSSKRRYPYCTKRGCPMHNSHIFVSTFPLMRLFSSNNPSISGISTSSLSQSFKSCPLSISIHLNGMFSSTHPYGRTPHQLLLVYFNTPTSNIEKEEKRTKDDSLNERSERNNESHSISSIYHCWLKRGAFRWPHTIAYAFI